MSEEIVKFQGDTTARELWENGPTVSTGLSRVLSPNNRNFGLVAFQQAKPILDSELNLMQQIQNKLRADILRTIMSSGIISMDVQAGITDKKNTLRISGAMACVNGWLLTLSGSNRNDAASDIVFPAAPNSGSREDLAFVECWFEEVAPSGSPEDDDENVYRYGGIASGTLANDLQDNVAGAETTRRIQLRWNFRTVTDVNFTTHPKGVDNGDRVKARAGAQSDTNYTFGSVGNGLYRAGDGSSAACTALRCVDGYVYALPLFRVHRRNQTAYNATDNKEGAPAYNSGTQIATGLYHDVIAVQDVLPLYPIASAYEQSANRESDQAVLKELFQAVHQQAAELTNWKTQRIQQGTATIYNKFVVAGGIINAIDGTRNVKITRTGTYSAANYSLMYVDGMLVSIYDTQDSVATVPTNSGSAAANYYAYVDNDGDKYKVKVADSVPDGKLGLYRITIPAGDTAANLNNAKFTDIRRVESHYSNYYGTIPATAVTLPYAAIGSDYSVALNIESTAYNRDTVLEVTGKSPNGFTIKSHGVADNVVVRWTLTQPNA
ncbi:hypothetical protein MEEL106852_01155 [Megasphaera elsdenii]|uniref:Uncharacterized protein n=1 Tax=Megasphaera elsdenii DSM 20460 TaxID=1064535 RepID=G0VPF7_MEGEL|nr:hypothetical protein [Megasphaera elsdenii]CCC73335.1 putative uncharacterized protein [Megasphaera elsdenii DSM 20460]